MHNQHQLQEKCLGRRCRCCRRWFCISFVLLFVPGFLRLIYSDVHGCGMMGKSVTLAAPQAPSWPWFVTHWIGMRNVAVPIQLFIPGYSQALYWARPLEYGRHCALTIDDFVGPNFYEAERLLDLLRRLNVSATFFVTADKFTTSDQGRQLLRRAFAEGHEIGNHGVIDAPMWMMSRDDVDEAITSWEKAMRSILPRWPAHDADRKWFRPPIGLMSPILSSVLEERGYHIAIADIWSDDTGVDNANFHTRVIESATCDGSIIVLHTPSFPSRLQTLEIINRSVPLLRKRGLAFLRLTDLFAGGSNDQGPGCVNCTYCTASTVAFFLVTLLFCCRCILRCFCRANYEVWCLRSGGCRSVQPAHEETSESDRRRVPETE